MASRVHRPLKIIPFNADGIGRQRHELSKQLQDICIDVVLFSETYLKPDGPIPGQERRNCRRS
jgi:hypothetical protein